MAPTPLLDASWQPESREKPFAQTSCKGKKEKRNNKRQGNKKESRKELDDEWPGSIEAS